MSVIAPSLLFLILFVGLLFVYRRGYVILICGLLLSVLGLLEFIVTMILIIKDDFSPVSPPDHEMVKFVMTVGAIMTILVGIAMLAIHFTKTKQD